VRLVIDASVAAKWFNLEELSDKAADIKEAHVRGNLELAAPIHIIYEVGNSIGKNKQLTEAEANDAIAALLQLNVQLLEPTTERAKRAMNIAKSTNTTFYDAIYLQAAEELNTALLTADNVQVKAGREIAKVTHLQEIKL
jgi:predicted nucleic acid-binding protein